MPAEGIGRNQLLRKTHKTNDSMLGSFIQISKSCNSKVEIMPDSHKTVFHYKKRADARGIPGAEQLQMPVQ